MKESQDGPTLLRFRITDTASGRIVAVVEATNALDAHRRFERVRPRVQFIEQLRLEVYGVQEQSAADPVRCSFFLQGFFDVLDQSERLRRNDH